MMMLGIERPGTRGSNQIARWLAWRVALLQILRKFFSDSLARNGYSLVLNAAVTSLLGFAFWVLCARLFTKAEVGLGAALISMLFTLGGLAQLNLGNILNRYLAVSGSQTTRLIVIAYLVAGSLAAFGSAVFVMSVQHIAPTMRFMSEDVWAASAFVVATIFWTLFSLQDSVLSGLRKSTWVPLENSLYGLSKIGLILLLPSAAILLGSPVFTAWVIPLVVIVCATNVLIFQSLVPSAKRQANTSQTVSFREVVYFFGWDYAGTTATMLCYGAAKLIVLNMAGPSDLAVYHLAWTVAYSLYLVGHGMSTSLLAEGAADTARLRVLTSDILIHTFVVVILGAVLLTAAAPLIMSMFGSAYMQESITMLRILVLSSIPSCFITIYLGVARLRGHLSMVAIVQFSVLALVVMIGPLLVQSFGATGMAITWLFANGIVAIGILSRIILTNEPLQNREWLTSLLAAWQRQIGKFRTASNGRSAADAQDDPA